MAKLILTFNGDIEDEFILDKERITLGRKPANDIQIDNLAISGQHALILTILNDSFIEDLGSTNGTYVNRKLTKKHALRDGDIIGIGKHELKYVNDLATSDEDDFEKTMVIRPGSIKAATSAAMALETTGSHQNAQTTTPHSLGMPQGKLHVLNGPIAGKELVLTKALITLGKPGVQVAVISRRPQGYFLTHIEGNKNGEQNYPHVNGESIGAKAYTLHDNDIVELAGIKMEFTLSG